MDSSFNCVICLKNLNMNDGVLTPCGHRYHSECFFKWIYKKKTCPLCREVLISPTEDEEFLHEVYEKTIYVLDMRTVTGTLGKNLKHVAGDIPFNYTILFDANHYADLSSFDDGLSDEERIIWLSKEEYKQLDIENITHNYIKEISAVKEIKKYLD